MIRKAETLKSVDDLNVSTETRAYLKMNFDSIDDIIKYGRCLDYDMYKGAQKWKLELLSAIREAGFVRPREDFVASFGVAYLYSRIFTEVESAFVYSIDRLSNEEYENFYGIWDEDVECVRRTLSDILTKDEYRIIHYLYLYEPDNGVMPDIETIALCLQDTPDYVDKTSKLALSKLAENRYTLPAVFDAPSAVNAVISDMRSKLDELHKHPAFAEARGLLAGLKSIGELPFQYSNATRKQLDLNGLFDFDIDI